MIIQFVSVITGAHKIWFTALIMDRRNFLKRCVWSLQIHVNGYRLAAPATYCTERNVLLPQRTKLGETFSVSPHFL